MGNSFKRLWTGTVRLCGWHYLEPDADVSRHLDRCVIIMAPHTAIADFLLGAGYLWKLGVNCRILIKKEFFRWPLGNLLKRFGAIPVDRGNPRDGMIERSLAGFRDNERFTLVITPEGTRKKVTRWKRGFYEIATKAGVPVLLSFIDYKNKTMGFKGLFMPTGNYDADIKEIKNNYRDAAPKHPEGWQTID
ncbi:MAG: 1-acyl-sn-glycerol-3-phosphate acyltransferase [Bacteroidales bacterium]|nr:1-acyl-sn-glycerol-3-phosphate acyltransferase [Bacteroidales bacterium]